MRERTLAARRQQYRDDLAQALDAIVAQLDRHGAVRLAVLFGSYARGRTDLFTDLDILIVMDSPLDFVTRTAEMYRYLSCPVDVDLLVYTPEELERVRQRAFIRQALEGGKVIYERRTAGLAREAVEFVAERLAAA